jgi:hypothetical protein
MHGHTSGDEGGCGEKAKQHKFKIIGVVVVLLVGVILLVTLTGSSGDNPGPGPNPPGPNPPGPTPPIPANSGFNPYYLDENSTISAQKNKVSGTLFFNQTVIDNGPKIMYGGNGSEGLNLTLTPNEIPRGANNNLTT